MHHLAPNTSSSIVSKSISKNGGKVSYRGLVHFGRKASGARSNIECDTLIMDMKDAVSVDEHRLTAMHAALMNGGVQNKWINFLTATFVNVFRAIPFIILILLLFPFTDFIVGTIRGPNAALPALIIGAAPFYGRLVEIALREVDKGVIEAAKAMGTE